MAAEVDRKDGGRQEQDEQLEQLMRAEFSRLGVSAEPTEEQGTRRRLLLIYVHGFMGSEESFRSFPAHVHSLLAILLRETHVVHSKIYPRYRSKQYIKVARDDFSKWLAPHESPDTDTILLGHSMGGLIAAEVVLMPSGEASRDAFRHRIIGTLNFDVPFLGMHPGVVRSGLASLFNPAKEPEDQYESTDLQNYAVDQMESASAVSSEAALDSDNSSFWEARDANFNAKFSNDVVLPARRFWQSVGHFVHKHGRDVANATSHMVGAHVEFMSAMSNSKELRSRYSKIRVLEDDSETLRRSVGDNGRTPPRVRFANYYTISSGRSKAAESEGNTEPAQERGDAVGSKESEQADGMEQALAPPVEEQTVPLESAVATQNAHLSPFGEVIEAEPVSRSRSKSPTDDKPPKAVKQGTFCNLPPKDAQGEIDPTWIRMFMADVDEVGAHCGMFFVDARYERFVGDVASRVEDWVTNDLSVRAAQAALEAE